MAFNKFRTHKFGAEKATLDEYSFSSKLEAAVYQLLKFRLAAKEIENIEVQQHVYLSDARILYVPDFKCTDREGNSIYCEAKGFEGERWPTIKKLWKHYGPAPLEIFKGSYKAPQLIETIFPVKK
jgi:Protein of unknown function (DUF1064)